MKKPVEQTFKALDWNECEEWIREKYHRDIRNWAGKTWRPEDDKPYQDFWHYICENYDIHDKGFFTLCEYFKPALPWQIEIQEIIFKEFGNEEDEIEFYVSY